MYSTFIKNRRKDKGMLQKDIAKILNISTRQYKRWEEGKITMEQMALLGKILGFSIQFVPDECKIYTV